MAVALDQVLGGGQGASGTPGSMTTAAAVTAGAYIILLAGRFSPTTGSTLSVTTTGGLTWTTDHTVTSGSLRITQFRALAPAGLASGTALGVTNSSGGDMVIGAVSYTGIDTTGTVVAVNGGPAATAAWSSLSVAGSAGNALIGGAFVDAGAVSSSTPGGSAVERIDRNVLAQVETLVVEDILSIGGSTALTGTWNAAASHIAIAVAYKDAGGGAAAVQQNLTLMGVGS